MTVRLVARAALLAAISMVASANGGAAQQSVFDAPHPAPVPVVVAPALLGESGAPPAMAPAAALWQERRGRQTWRFARWGALLGGAAGFTVGGLYALYCSGGVYDDCGSVWFGMTALGVASGFVGGAIIGSAVPAPRQASPPVPPADPADPAASPGRDLPPGTQRGRLSSPIGSAVISAGLAGASIADEDGATMEGMGASARVSVQAELLPWLGLGPEAGVATFGDAGDIRHVALAARIRGSGRIAPFGSFNVGAYDSTAPSLEYLGAGVGAGVRMEAGTTGRYFLEAEARHSRNAQNIAPMRMWSVTVSGGLYW